MPLRPLTAFEAPIAAAVVNLGSSQGWEFAAYLDSRNGPVIEIRSLMRNDGADPSQDVLRKAGNGQLVVHHNHLSHESLSFPDWCGLARVFDETWAHCEDGTIYRGRVLNVCEVKKILRQSSQAVEMNAENELFKVLLAQNIPDAGVLAGLYRKEVVNRAMQQRGFVEYEYAWGTQNVPPRVSAGASPVSGFAGQLGNALNIQIDAASTALANTL